ncbi:hypothetical protein [Microcoleus sp.]|uniref:hypothetical protein n=1 Tax=Microcoleus sp. TaxID=44472 RepID=UPI003592EB81
MTETDALIVLRSAVSQFDRSEKLALAAFLVTQCNPRFVSVIHEAEPVFGENLDAALAATGKLPQQAKLSFAIELVRFCQDEEEDFDEEAFELAERTKRMAWCRQDGPYEDDEEEW